MSNLSPSNTDSSDAQSREQCMKNELGPNTEENKNSKTFNNSDLNTNFKTFLSASLTCNTGLDKETADLLVENADLSCLGLEGKDLNTVDTNTINPECVVNNFNNNKKDIIEKIIRAYLKKLLEPFSWVNTTITSFSNIEKDTNEADFVDKQIKEQKKLEEIANPSFFKRILSRIIYDNKRDDPNYIAPSRKHYSSFIVGSVSFIFFIIYLIKFNVISDIPGVLKSLFFWFKRYFVFILCVTLILFTYKLIFTLPKWFQKLIKSIAYAINPRLNKKVDERYTNLTKWKFIGGVYENTVRVYYIIWSFILFSIIFLILLPFIIFFGYLIGCILTFMNDDF